MRITLRKVGFPIGHFSPPPSCPDCGATMSCPNDMGKSTEKPVILRFRSTKRSGSQLEKSAIAAAAQMIHRHTGVAIRHLSNGHRAEAGESMKRAKMAAVNAFDRDEPIHAHLAAAMKSNDDRMPASHTMGHLRRCRACASRMQGEPMAKAHKTPLRELQLHIENTLQHAGQGSHDGQGVGIALTQEHARNILPASHAIHAHLQAAMAEHQKSRWHSDHAAVARHMRAAAATVSGVKLSSAQRRTD